MRTRAAGLLLALWITRGIATVGVILLFRGLIWGITGGDWEVGILILGFALIVPWGLLSASVRKS